MEYIYIYIERAGRCEAQALQDTGSLDFHMEFNEIVRLHGVGVQIAINLLGLEPTQSRQPILEKLVV